MILDLSPPFVFAILAVALLIVELAAPIGVFLFLAGASGATTGIVWAADLGWQAAIGVYSLATLAALFAWYKKGPKALPTPVALNDRAASVLDRQACVIAEIAGGRGTVQIDDVIWPARADCDIAAGATVVVTGLDGNFVTVQPA
jgi:hypothetical protein